MVKQYQTFLTLNFCLILICNMKLILKLPASDFSQNELTSTFFRSRITLNIDIIVKNFLGCIKNLIQLTFEEFSDIR